MISRAHYIAACVLIMGGVALWLSLLAQTSLGFHMPIIGKRLEAHYFTILSTQYAPSSIEHLRFSAIGQALRQGQTSYTFKTSLNPALNGGGS